MWIWWKLKNHKSKNHKLDENQTILIKIWKIDHVLISILHAFVGIKENSSSIWKISESCIWIRSLWTWWKLKNDKSKDQKLSENEV